jgi:hypothetical protein
MEKMRFIIFSCGGIFWRFILRVSKLKIAFFGGMRRR